MALATRCPHCQTTFRVAHDQLKLRAGLVRCGSCKEIFNGVEHLLPPSEALHTETPPATTPIVNVPAPLIPVQIPVAPFIAPAIEPPPVAAPQSSSEIDFEPFMVAPESVPEEPTQPLPIMEATPDPLQRMTLLHRMETRLPREHSQQGKKQNSDDPVTDSGDLVPLQYDQHNPDVPDELDLAIADLQKKPLRSSKKSARRKESAAEQDAESDEPDFVKRDRRRRRLGRSLRILMGLLTFILLIAAALQGTYIFRNQLAAWFPPAKPTLAKACVLIGCQVGLPAQIEVVSIESSELQTLNAGKSIVALNALLHNRSQTAQAWPNVELTLSDANEQAIARRIFTPSDYLPSGQDWTSGFAPNSEQSIKLFLDLSLLKASGYRIYLYYP